MDWEYLKQILVEYERLVFIMLGWGVCLGAVTLWAIFQGFLLPRVQGVTGPPTTVQFGPLGAGNAFYIAIFGICILAALNIADLGKSLIGFFGSYVLGAVITYEVLFIPGLIGSDTAFREILAMLTVEWTFRAFFPFTLFIGLFGTIVGAGLEEWLLS